VEVYGNHDRDGNQQRTCYGVSEVEMYHGDMGNGEDEGMQLIHRISRLRVFSERQDFDEGLRVALAARAERLYWRLRVLQRESAHDWKCRFGLKTSTALVVVGRRAA
jgi:hypothetical protein